jgi:hypothetical protein
MVHVGLILIEVAVDLLLDGGQVHLPQQVEEHAEELAVVPVHVEVPLREHDVPDAHLPDLGLPLQDSATVLGVALEEEGESFLHREMGTYKARMELRSMQYLRLNSTNRCSGSLIPSM